MVNIKQLALTAALLLNFQVFANTKPASILFELKREMATFVQTPEGKEEINNFEIKQIPRNLKNCIDGLLTRLAYEDEKFIKLVCDLLKDDNVKDIIENINYDLVISELFDFTSDLDNVDYDTSKLNLN